MYALDAVLSLTQLYPQARSGERHLRRETRVLAGVLTDRFFIQMGPKYRHLEAPSIRVKHSICRPTCQIRLSIHLVFHLRITTAPAWAGCFALRSRHSLLN